jgi:putative CocE/NonD family hydrolase
MTNALSVRIDKNIAIPMRDGVILRADVWRPNDDNAYPALLSRTPYQKERMVGNDFLPYDQAAAAGYVVVVQDTRGRFASDGEWEGFMWHREAPDTYDTVEWVAGQPWCNGNVGLWGISYLAAICWLGAMERPPHLKAIAPAMVSDGPLGMMEVGGAFRLESLMNWFVFQLLSDVLPKHITAGTATPEMIARLNEAARNPRLVTEYLPLKKSPYLDVPGCPVTLDELFSKGINIPTFRFEDVEVPALLVGGWFDIAPTGVIEEFRALRSRGGGGEKVCQAHRLIMGPWTHTVNLTGNQGELNFGLLSQGIFELLPAHLAFFDQHLKGLEASLPAVRYFLMGANEWRNADDWPVPGATRQDWYLGSGGKANTAAGDGILTTVSPNANGSADQYRYDPGNPVHTHGGKLLSLGESVAGPFNQQHLEMRQDVLCYSSKIFDQAMDIVGPVVLRLYAASSAKDTDFVAKLIDVFPDGRSMLVCDGCRRARFRRGFDKEVFLKPGEVEEYEINLAHTAWRVKPGHRLRVHVTSSNFPHLDRNMNTGHAIGDDAQGIIAEQTIFHDGRRPSRLELCILPAK